MSSQSLLQTNNTLNTLNNTLDGQYLASGNNGSEVRLVGSHFKDPLFVAPIVINAICAAGFFILTIYSWVRGFSAKESRKAFIVMMSLLGGMTFSFIRTFTDGLIHEYQPLVPPAFLALPAFKPILNNTLDIALLLLIHRIIKNRNRALTPPTYAGYPHWQHLHSLLLAILALLGLADTALYIYAQVPLFTQAQKLDPKFQSAADKYKDIHLTYTTLYLAVSTEILFCAAFLFQKAHRLGLHTRITTYTLTLLAPPLTLRSTILLAAAIRFSYQPGHTESRLFAVLETALYALPSLVIFTGVVLIQFCRGWEPGPCGYPGLRGAVGNGEVQEVAGGWEEPPRWGGGKEPVVEQRVEPYRY